MELRHILRPEVIVPPGYNAATLTYDRPDWKQTFTGAGIFVADPETSEPLINLTDMAVALAGTNRYDRHTMLDLPVASHSILVEAMMMQDAQDAEAKFDRYLDGLGGRFNEDPDYEADRLRLLSEANALSRVDMLLHDAHEYVLGDQTNPVAGGFEMRLPGFRKMIKTLKRDWDIAIYNRLQLPYPDEDRQSLVHEYDMRALYVERDFAMMPPPAPWIYEDRLGGISVDYPKAKPFMVDAAHMENFHLALLWLARLEAALCDSEAQGLGRCGEALRLVADAQTKIGTVIQTLGLTTPAHLDAFTGQTAEGIVELDESDEALSAEALFRTLFDGEKVVARPNGHA